MSSCMFYSCTFFTFFFFFLLTFRSNNPKILLEAETSRIMSLRCRSMIRRLRKTRTQSSLQGASEWWVLTVGFASLRWDSWGRGPENLWLQLSLFSLLSAAGGFRRQGRREPFRKLLQPDQPVGRQLLLLLRRDRHHNHRWAHPRSALLPSHSLYHPVTFWPPSLLIHF